VLLSDNGPKFSSDAWSTALRKWGWRGGILLYTIRGPIPWSVATRECPEDYTVEYTLGQPYRIPVLIFSCIADVNRPEQRTPSCWSGWQPRRKWVQPASRKRPKQAPRRQNRPQKTPKPQTTPPKPAASRFNTENATEVKHPPPHVAG